MSDLREKLKLQWSTTVLGNVEIIGRPLSRAGSPTYSHDRATAQLKQAVIYARQMVNETHALVRRARQVARETLTGVGNIGLAGFNSDVHLAAVVHFKMPYTLDAANAQQWIDLFRHLDDRVYTSIEQGIGGSLKLVDIPMNDDSNGSVSLQNAHLLDPTDPQGLRGGNRGRIHINFQWTLTRTAHRVARTIIHEASHKFVGARDHAYKWQPRYQRLTPQEARANADSIACFAYYTWKNGVYQV